jgi:predicted PurR-regulated permease PerM
MPRVVATLLVVITIFVVIVLVLTIVVAGVKDVAGDLAFYQRRIMELAERLVEWLAEAGVNVPLDTSTNPLQPPDLFRTMARVAGDVGELAARVVFVMLIVIYGLMDVPRLKRRLHALNVDKSKNPEEGLEDFTQMMNRYLVIKTWVSIGTGGTAGLLLFFLGVDYALFWGLLAILLNFIPQVGALIAAVPPVALAFLTLGVVPGFLAIGAFIVGNIIFGNILEPRFLGIGFGLPIVVVLFSLGFWGWIFGLTGVFLAVPLTMSLIFVLRREPETRRLAYMLAGRTLEGRE